MLGHATIDSMTLAQARANVDWAVDYGGGVEFMFHPAYIGKAGFMTVADFTALVDYVKTRWDAGDLEVLSPSGLAFADPGYGRRMDLLRRGGFEGLSFVGNALGPWTAANTTGVTVGADGGREGSNYTRWAAGSNSHLHQSYTYIGESNVQGAAFMAEAWFRQPDGVGSATGRIQLLDNSGANPTFASDKRITLPAGSGWTRLRVPFCIPQTCTNLMIRVSRLPDGQAGNLDIDDVHIWAA